MGGNLPGCSGDALNTKTLMQQEEPEVPHWWILAGMFSLGFLAGALVILWLGMILLSQRWAGPYFVHSAS